MESSKGFRPARRVKREALKDIVTTRVSLKLLTMILLACGIQTVTAGQISGSAHDFSTESWAGGRVCIACHAPHHTDVSTSDAPLWNHAVTSQTYTLYNSATLDATVGQPGGLSKLCLSCHDGTVAVDSFGTVTGTEFLTGGNNLGSNLNDDHPIGFVYDTALANTDGSLHLPTTAATIGAGAQQKSGTIQSVLLFNDRMECSSCHDVHNTFTADSGDALVKITQSNSTLCLTCHDK